MLNRLGTSRAKAPAIISARRPRFATSIRASSLACFSLAAAPEYLRYDPHLLAITRHFFAAGKPVASVCHGIEILTAADCIRGRRVTTVAKCALDAQQGGADYVDQPCVVDGNLVTARTWHDNTPFLKAFIELLTMAQR